MHKDQVKTLLRKYEEGTCTAEEKAWLETWFLRQQATDLPTSSEIAEDLDAVWAALNKDYQRPAKMVNWPRIAAAASIIFVLGIGGYFYVKPSAKTTQVLLVKNDIAPGKQTATLTLANGRRLVLSAANNGTLAKEAGVSITKTADGQLVYTVEDNGAVNGSHTLSTAKGETYKVNLPDGSQVWLNAASSLTYPARFAGAERKVTLTGEGYFEVAKDKAHPFRVATADQEVTVLGTHFNINAYSNETATRTTLLEGSVKVNTKIIKPGQQAANNGGTIKVQEIDTELATAWKNNKFIFDNDDIRYIMRLVERWYNVEVEYNGTVTDARFGGAVSRYENVSEVLKPLESTGKVHFRIEGRKIIVTK